MSIEVGQIIECKITAIAAYGAFAELPDKKSGMIHISEISDGFVKNISEYIKIGESVKVKVIKIDENGRIALSLKQANGIKVPASRTENPEEFQSKSSQRKPAAAYNSSDPPMQYYARSSGSSDNFEEMMNHFKTVSNERIADLKKNTDGKRSGGYSKKSYHK